MDLSHIRREYRCVAHDGQNFTGHLHNDGVRVAIGHETSQRSSSGHAVAAGVVDDDEIRLCSFSALGGDPCARTTADDGNSRRTTRLPSLQTRRSVHDAASPSCPAESQSHSTPLTLHSKLNWLIRALPNAKRFIPVSPRRQKLPDSGAHSVFVQAEFRKASERGVFLLRSPRGIG